MAPKLETILYAVGGLFALATIIYFAWEYLTALPKSIKAVLLGLLVIVFMILSKVFEERDI